MSGAWEPGRLPEVERRTLLARRAAHPGSRVKALRLRRCRDPADRLAASIERR